jgi:hypothetical protein
VQEEALGDGAFVTPSAIASLLKDAGVLLESVKATVTAEQLARGVDLLRTRGNEITFIAGRTVEHQVWQSVVVSSEDPSVQLALSVGGAIVGSFAGGKARFAKMLLVERGSVVHAIARAASATATVRITLEIFGWAATDAMLPTVKDALRLMEAS